VSSSPLKGWSSNSKPAPLVDRRVAESRFPWSVDRVAFDVFLGGANQVSDIVSENLFAPSVAFAHLR
jgi:hypothetical protein